MEFCLRHLSGVRNYPDYKIKEFKERLSQLETEYKRFVAKCKALDPTMPGVPGDPHAYVSKRKLAELVHDSLSLTIVNKIHFDFQIVNYIHHLGSTI
jgi:hypothetical protein